MSTKNQNSVKPTSSNNLFEKFYYDDKDSLRASKAPVVQRNLERKYGAAYDDALNQIEDTKAEIDTKRAELKGDNLNVILSLHSRIEQLEKAAKYIAFEYEAMFGKPLPQIA